MLDKREIDEAIAELEGLRNHSNGDCTRLAALYSIRDHMAYQDMPHDISAYSLASAPIEEPIAVSDSVGNYGNSDFLLAVYGKAPASVWQIVDDLMGTLQVANPRVYDSVMRKIRQL